MKAKNKGEEGVSPVIGEMLMLCLVLILVSLFAVSASNDIPEDREPSLNVMIGDTSGISNNNVTLWHKGGDTVSKRDIKVIFSNEANRFVEYYENITINNDTSVMNFMPGDYMKVSTKADVSGYTIQMVVSKSVIFFGRVDN